MRHLLATSFGILLLLAGAAGAADGDFFSRLGDVPVMPGLHPAEDAGMEFDSSSGRIVEAYATGAVARKAVLKFYRQTLPQLGWSAGAGDAFRREGESLRIDFFGPDGGLTVRFTIAPTASGG